MRRFAFFSLLGGVALAVTLTAGCGPNDKPTANNGNTPYPQGNQTAAADTGPKPPGVVAFETARCNNCHATAGSAKTGRGMGPDLTKVGAKRDKDWIVAHIRDPKSHNPMSRMPSTGPDKLTDADAGTIGEYLAGLK